MAAFLVPQVERAPSFQTRVRSLPGMQRLGSRTISIPQKVIADWTRPLFEGGLGPGAGSSFFAAQPRPGSHGARVRLSNAIRKLPRESAEL